MSIKERIKELKATIDFSMGSEKAAKEDYANDKLDDAAEIAEEADVIMEDMAGVIDDLEASSTHTSLISEAKDILRKYEQFKESQ